MQQQQLNSSLAIAAARRQIREPEALQVGTNSKEFSDASRQ